MNNRFFLGDDIQGILLGLIFLLLGTGSLLSVFMILIFMGAALAKEEAIELPEPSPKIEEYQTPSEQVFASAEQKETTYYL